MRRAALALLQRQSLYAVHTRTTLAGCIARHTQILGAVVSARCDPSSHPQRRFLRIAAAGRPTRADVPPSPSALQSSSDSTGSELSSSLSPSAPLPFAVVGSGPAAFYTSKYLLRELPHARVDMFERLAVPGGLVRFGVAPDHPDVKAVSHDFEQVSNDSRFAFWGNVVVGQEDDARSRTAAAHDSQQAPVSVEDLRSHYAGVIFAYGASSERSLNIPGAQLRGIHPSRHFVQWYNSHPDLHPAASAPTASGAAPPPPLIDFDLSGVEHAVIVGQGNVAVDCARILLSPLHRLEHTDISTAALERLRASRVSRVSMLGRRGAIQSAFSIGELRELATGVEGLRVVLDKDEMSRSETEASKKELDSRPTKRKYDLMMQVLHGTLTPNIKSPSPSPAAATDAASSSSPSVPPSSRELHIRYLLSPREFLPSASDPSRVGAIVLERTELRGAPGSQEAVPTGEVFTMPTQLVLTSIGYRSLPLSGLPFDARRSIIPSVGSRVVSDRDGSVLAGCYVSGWVKRGPSGIIASNILDARETVKAIVEDVKSGRVGPPRIQTGLPLLSSAESIARHRLVTREAWGHIDAIEQARGMEQGKPRVKMTSKEEMLQAAAQVAPSKPAADFATNGSLKSD